MKFKVESSEHEAVSAFKQHMEQLCPIEALKVLSEVANHAFKLSVNHALIEAVKAAETASGADEQQYSFEKLARLASLASAEVKLDSVPNPDNEEGEV